MQKNNDQKTIWNVIKETRKIYLSKHIESECQNYDTIVRNDHLAENIRAVEDKLNLNLSTNTISEDVGQETLETAAEMFTYLNYCPPEPFKNLVRLFRQDLFKSGNLASKDILLALASIIQSSQNAIKESSTRVLRKTMKILNLVQHENIENVGMFNDNSTKESLFNEELQRVTNHPVHIMDPTGTLSPTALVPFCSFGGDMSVMGVKIDQFDVPVCNSFSPKIVKDQLCFTVNPNKYKKSVKDQGELSLTLFMNLNEERQLLSGTSTLNDDNFSIIVETIGKIRHNYFYKLKHIF